MHLNYSWAIQRISANRYVGISDSSNLLNSKCVAPHRHHKLVPPGDHSPLIQKRDVTHRVRRIALWSKNVTLLTGCAEWLSDPKTWRNSWGAPNVFLIVMLLTQGAKGPFTCLDMFQRWKQKYLFRFRSWYKHLKGLRQPGEGYKKQFAGAAPKPLWCNLPWIRLTGKNWD